MTSPCYVSYLPTMHNLELSCLPAIRFCFKGVCHAISQNTLSSGRVRHVHCSSRTRVRRRSKACGTNTNRRSEGVPVCSNDKLRFCTRRGDPQYPISLRQAAIKVVSQRRYKGNAKRDWDTSPVGHSARQVMLAVIFPHEKGARPKIEQAMPAGVSSCVPAPPLPNAPPSWLFATRPVIPVLAAAGTEK